MADKRVIGIDFGTDVSAVRVKNYDSMGRYVDSKTETGTLVFENGSSLVPTIARRDKQGERNWYGYDAILARRDTELIRNFKTMLVDARGEARLLAQELTAGFFEYLHTRYAAECARGVFGAADAQETTYICVPCAWNDQIKTFVCGAAQNAGFRGVRIIDDAQAALRCMATMYADQIDARIAPAVRGNILLLDMGAQTTQLTLLSHTVGSLTGDKILSARTGAGTGAFGGLETDAYLAQYVSGLLAPDVRGKIVTRLHMEGAIRTWKEKNVSPVLSENGTVWDFEDMESLCSLMGAQKPEIALNRAAFEQMTAPYLARFPRLVDECLRAGGVEPQQVDVILLSGGHSSWYFVREMLLGKMPRLGMPLLQKIVHEPTRIIAPALPQQICAIGAAQCAPAAQPNPQAQQQNPQTRQPNPRAQQQNPRAQVPPYQNTAQPGGKAAQLGKHLFSEFSQKQYKLYGERNAADMAQYLAAQLQKKNGVTTQIVRDSKVLFLQARDKSGAWKQFLGMDRAVTVQFVDMGDNVVVTVGQGKWIDKGIAAAASLIAFWPLMVTTMIGVYGQLDLRTCILQITDEYVGR